jgi:hypothetical protein
MEGTKSGSTEQMGCMQDSHFRAEQGLLEAFILVKHLQIITYCLLTVCADVTIFLHEISLLGLFIYQ